MSSSHLLPNLKFGRFWKVLRAIMSNHGSPGSDSDLSVTYKFVDYKDFPGTSKDKTVGFFRDVAALNSVFRNRVNQLLTLHPGTPLGETLEEYLRFQRVLEEKYQIDLGFRDSSVSSALKTRFDRSDASSPSTSSSVSPAENRSSFSSNSNDQVATTSKSSHDQLPFQSRIPVFRPTKPVETEPLKSLEREPRQSLKRKPEDDHENQWKKPSGSEGASKDVLIVPASNSQKSSAKSDSPKLPVFGGFDLPKTTTSDKPSMGIPNFTPVFPSSIPSGFAFSAPVKSASAVEKPLFQPNLNGFDKQISASASSQDKVGGVSAQQPDKNGGFSFPAFSATDKSSIFGGASTGNNWSLGGFKFGPLIPAVPTKPAAEDDKDGGDEEGGDEDDAPPIVLVEDQEVAEPDAVVSSRCKLFYLDAGQFAVRGTGTAHIKIINDDAFQLLVRAGTALGAVLLNVRIGKDAKVMRTTRKETETVDVLSLANPTFKGADPKKLYQFVLKFKNAEIADKFYHTLRPQSER